MRSIRLRDEIEGGPEGPRSDFVVMERALEYARSVNFEPQRCAARGVNGNAARELDKTQRLYLDAARNLTMGKSRRVGEAESLAELAKALLCAYPDHLAVRRNETNLACALVGNRRGQLDPSTVARRVGLVLPVEVREIGAGNSAKTVLSMVSEIEVEWLREMEGNRVRRETATVFDAEMQAAQTVDREMFHDLVISESARHEPDRAAAAEVLASKVLDGTLKLERWDEEVEQWIARVRCVAEWFPERGMITYDEDERRLIIEEMCAGGGAVQGDQGQAGDAVCEGCAVLGGPAVCRADGAGADSVAAGVADESGVRTGAGAAGEGEDPGLL